MVSDDMLSQDEIDALLRGGDDDDGGGGDEPSVDDYLSAIEQDALGEVGNISFGSSATALSTLLNQKVDITTPRVSIIQKAKLQEEFPDPYVAIEVEYTVGFRGSNILVIKTTDAAIIADLMLGGDGTNPSEDLGEIQLSAVQEAMNQMMGSAATSMSTVFSKKVDISPPAIDILNVKDGDGTDRLPDEDVFVQISFNLKIGDLIDSNLMQLLPVDFAKELVDNLMNPPQEGEEEQEEQAAQPSQPPQQEQAPQPQAPQQQAPPPDYGMQQQQQMPPQPQMDQQYQQQAYQQQGYPPQQPYPQQPAPGYYQQPPMQQMPPQTGPQHIGGGFYGQNPDVQSAEFTSFGAPNLQPQEANNLNMLLDIPLQVTVELGRTKRSVQEILELSPGSIVELDKLAGEPVDILVNNKLIATGEVVVIEENFGVRVTDIISQKERMKKLQ
ncbi:flagellar motor switch phosphatase FliY [Bacillus tianshenii]|nr:flagellar motor switch phosphatase FliY [Bacillus tianshenii]